MNINSALVSDFTHDDIVQMLYRHYALIVYHRTGHMYQDTGLMHRIEQVAKIFDADYFGTGLMLCGNVGNGKSTVVLALRDMTNWLCKHRYMSDSLRLVSAKSVVNDEAHKDYYRALLEEPLLAIDDLGTENLKIVSYGQPSTPLADLLEYRYAHSMFTIVSTNLTAEQRKARYGLRLADRFNEMFTKVVFQNDSYRDKI